MLAAGAGKRRWSHGAGPDAPECQPAAQGGSDENLSSYGAYRLAAAAAPRKVVLVATGSEVEIAVAVRAALEEQGIGADVVSMPSMGLFRAQEAEYKADLLPADVLKVSIEAGTTWAGKASWARAV
jgi:transketolase